MSGIYNLSGGTLTVSGSTYVANNSSGTFNQSGGTHNTTNLYLAAGSGLKGNYSLSSTGALNATLSEYVGYNGTGTFNQSGGINTINGTLANGLYLGTETGSTGTYILSGGKLAIASNLDIGCAGSGAMINSGGDISTTSFYVGVSAPTMSNYNMTGGSLTIAGGSQFSYEIIGYGSAGTFSQHGGTNTLGTAALPVSLIIGQGNGVTGIYNLDQTVSNSSVIVTSNVGVASATGSIGVLNISGGSMTVAGTLVLSAPGAVGTVNLSGGTLTTASDQLGGSGTASFIQSGGAHTTGAMTLGSPLSYNMTGGTLSVTSALTGSGSVNQSGGIANVAGFSNFTGGVSVNNFYTVFNLIQGGLHESAGPISVALGTFAMNTPSRSVLTIPSLTIAPYQTGWFGIFDLGRNDLVITNGDLATVASQVKNGYNGGLWNGGGIDSSYAANDSTHLTAVGVLLNNNGNNQLLYNSSNLFDGTTPALNSILVKLTYYGDATLDGKVDASDYSKIDYGFLDHLTGWSNGDFNYDGVVNGSDYTLIDNAFNRQGAAMSAQVYSPAAIATAQIAPATAVPEPTTLGLLGITVLGMLGRRNRRQR